jgi:hypothetical protein
LKIIFWWEGKKEGMGDTWVRVNIRSSIFIFDDFPVRAVHSEEKHVAISGSAKIPRKFNTAPRFWCPSKTVDLLHPRDGPMSYVLEG